MLQPCRSREIHLNAIAIVLSIDLIFFVVVTVVLVEFFLTEFSKGHAAITVQGTNKSPRWSKAAIIALLQDIFGQQEADQVYKMLM